MSPEKNKEYIGPLRFLRAANAKNLKPEHEAKGNNDYIANHNAKKREETGIDVVPMPIIPAAFRTFEIGKQM